MHTRIRVVLYGSLRRPTTGGARPSDEPLQLDLPQPQTLARVLERLGIPSGRVELAMVNHRAVAPVARNTPFLPTGTTSACALRHNGCRRRLGS